MEEDAPEAAPGAAVVEERPRGAELLSWAAAAVIVVALGAALAVLPYILVAGAGDASLRDLVAGVGIGVPSALLVALVWWLARRSPGPALALALLAFVIVRLLVVLTLDGSLSTDWEAHHRLAIGWTLGAPPLANRPMGYPILLGELYRLGGSDPHLGELLNLALASVGALLLAGCVSLLAGRGAAALAVAILAVAPSQALFVVLLASETLFTTLLLAAALLVTLLIVAVRRGWYARLTWLLAGAAGVLLGASAAVRPTSLLIAPFVAALPVLLWPNRRGVVLGAMAASALVISVAPAVALNKVLLDRWSPTTSMYSGWQLFVGLNVDDGGRRTQADVRRLDRAAPGYRPGRLPREYSAGIFDPETLRLAAARDEVALGLALDRLREDWPRLPLSVPFKLAYGWGPGGSAVGWIPDLRGFALGVSMAAQAWWIGVLAAAALWFRRARRVDPRPAYILSVFILPIALGSLALEVQPRYHEYVVPLLAGLAAIAVMPQAGASGGGSKPMRS